MVEWTGAFARDALQRVGKSGHTEQRAFGDGQTVRAEIGLFRPSAEVLAVELQPIVHAPRNGEPVACQFDGWLEQGCPWQAPVTLMSKSHHRQRAGHSSAFAADVHFLRRQRFPIRAVKPLRSCRGWRGFAAIDAGEPMGLAVAANEETAATLKKTGAPCVEKPFLVQQFITVIEKTLGKAI